MIVCRAKSELQRINNHKPKNERPRRAQDKSIISQLRECTVFDDSNSSQNDIESYQDYVLEADKYDNMISAAVIDDCSLDANTDDIDDDSQSITDKWTDSDDDIDIELGPNECSMNAPKPMIFDEDEKCGYEASVECLDADYDQNKITVSMIYDDLNERQLVMKQHYFVHFVFKPILICYLLCTLIVFSALLLMNAQTYQNLILHETTKRYTTSKSTFNLPEICGYNVSNINNDWEYRFHETDNETGYGFNIQHWLQLTVFCLFLGYMIYLLWLWIEAIIFLRCFDARYSSFGRLKHTFGLVCDYQIQTPKQEETSSSSEDIVEDEEEICEMTDTEFHRSIHSISSLEP